MNFSKKDGRYHIYHSEGGEGYLKFLTRANVVCVGWASMLLGFELLNPFFGWWHGLSNSFMVIMGLVSSRMLHHYSTRMVNDMWILSDGKEKIPQTQEIKRRFQEFSTLSKNVSI